MVELSPEVALKMYEVMLRSRRLAEAIRKIYYEGKTPQFKLGAGLIWGGLHLPVGQEPTAVGVIIHLRREDAVFGSHRAMHLAIAKGVDTRRLMAEALGRKTGTNRGKGGHMHWFDTTVNFWCAPIVGAIWPHAVGAALAFKLRGENNVAVAYGGDGSSNQGTFHESLNLAAVWKLPVIFVIEDNKWAISTPKSRSTPIAKISDRASSYGIPGIFVPDNDLFMIFEVAKEAIKRARKGLGPTLIEIETYRFYGHFEGDVQVYRSKEEIEEIKTKDPIIKVKEELVRRGWLTKEEEERIDMRVNAEVEDAVKFARNSANPDPSEALHGVLANPPLEDLIYEPEVGLPQGDRRLPMFKAIQEAIAQEMGRDPSVFIMGEDIGAFGGIWSETQGLLDRFGPERVRDTPISESAFVGAAVGASAFGMRPIVDLMFIDFIGVAFDQIYNHLAKNHYISGGQVKHPVVLITPVGGGHGDAAHHSQSIYSLLAHAPGLKIAFPSNSYDAKGLMIRAIRDDDPVVYIFHKWTMGLPFIGCPETAVTHVPAEPYEIPFGRARIVKEGRDVTVIATGLMVHKALKAAEKLREENISVEVIDPRSLVPLDTKSIIDSVKKTGRVLVVDEDYLSYGVTGEIIAIIAERAFDYLKAPPERLAVPDVPIPYNRALEDFIIPSTEKIIEKVKRLVVR